MVKNENFITIQGWMLNELHLKGNELLVFALIYGFSQDENSVFSGSLSYMADWTNTTKQSVINTLQKLVEKNLIIKVEKIVNNIKLADYKINLMVVKNFDHPSQKFLLGGSQKFLPHNINNNNNNNIYNRETPSKKTILPPTLEECKDYAKELHCKKELGIEFFNYYNLSNWIDGKGKQIKCWKQKMYQWYMHDKNKYFDDIPDKPNCPTLEEVERFRKEHAVKY